MKVTGTRSVRPPSMQGTLVQRLEKLRARLFKQELLRNNIPRASTDAPIVMADEEDRGNSIVIRVLGAGEFVHGLYIAKCLVHSLHLHPSLLQTSLPLSSSYSSYNPFSWNLLPVHDRPRGGIDGGDD